MKILIILLLLPINVFAAEFHIENGSATAWFADTDQYTPATYSAISIRSEGSLFIEGIQGGWAGENNSRFVGLSFGQRSQGKYFAEYTFGGAYLLQPETTQLDGNKQFLISLGFGARFDNLFITAKLKHFSNSNTQGNNYGMDLKIIGIGCTF